MRWNTQKKFFKYYIKDKNALTKYMLLSIIVGFIELFGIALIYPFINKLLTGNKQAFLVGILIIFAFLAKNIFMIFYSYLQCNYVKECETKINKSLMNYFLRGDYEETSKISLSRKMHILNYLPANAINNYLVRVLNLIVNAFIFILISAFLFFKFFLATIITLVCAAILLYIQTSFLKNKTSDISKRILEANEQLNLASQEPLLNLKCVKIQNSEEFFTRKYKKNLENFKNLGQRILFYGIIPPYITEPFVIILLLILLSIISVQNCNNVEILMASYAVIAAAIFRLTPTISRMQTNINGINNAIPIIKELVAYYEEFKLENFEKPLGCETVEFQQSIELKKVDFAYNKNSNTLEKINLKINKGEFIGIAGASGAGKTTLADILTGILEINSGEIYIDGVLCPSKKMPKLNIGYIPQEISIVDGSIRENVAFAQLYIDDDRVIEALKQARLYEFINKNYSDGIYAKPFVDSNGFSQGQKQRLAIARALYINPDILIMDEGTSALDLETENEICEVLENLKGEKTIVAIAHRISTIKNCDKIVLMNSGRIEATGSFNELNSSNSYFKKLVELNSSNFIK